uniref:ATP synthase F0 subunit 6 n=1 Tax=Tessaromerus quadriarticulatus TaxID=3020145 RepID=UPI002410E855|nr:ATP synthase F0 subunit 6 [Tessaromerus quadriarticulatus]WEM32417.1 ATP synthase F0 subunit 6 [Tessaromerus quadriarticulatus]
MMNNLFSTFDPSTSMNFSLNWVSSVTSLIILPMNFWIMPSRIHLSFNKMYMQLFNEFKMLLGNNKGLVLIMVTLFMFILTNNMLGLLPYMFTSSSHLSFTMTLALPLWMSFMLFGWINNTKHMLAHMVPLGTPNMLMPFMVIIETVSNIIRPGSLAVRLTANMIAGHLLMSLLGNNAMNSSTMMLSIILFIQVMLMMFETAVSLIQAYVFSVLSTLYSSEV